MITSQTRKTVGAPLALVLAAATALSAAVIAPGARAQDGSDPPHPAHIHSGTCDNLGDIVEPLTDITLNTAGEVFGLDSAVPVEESDTEVSLSISDILGSPHAINIHESADAIQNYIACGDIGGRVVDGDLLIGLREINGSGHRGVAKLESDDDRTDVTVYLSWEGAAAQGQAESTNVPATTAETPAAANETSAPAATTEAAPATETATGQSGTTQAAEEVPVDIRNFSFNPNPVEVAVGGTVTWTNQDAVPHTATAEQRDVLQSGAIAPGSSFSQTFTTAGEFPYFCEFHPNMTGTIIVK
jgi:plastocyanin